jgi:hypothetical protein
VAMAGEGRVVVAKAAVAGEGRRVPRSLRTRGRALQSVGTCPRAWRGRALQSVWAYAHGHGEDGVGPCKAPRVCCTCGKQLTLAAVGPADGGRQQRPGGRGGGVLVADVVQVCDQGLWAAGGALRVSRSCSFSRGRPLILEFRGGQPCPNRTWTNVNLSQRGSTSHWAQQSA